MPEKQSEVWTRMQQLAADANVQQMRLMQQYADLYQKFLVGDAQAVDPAKAAQFFIEEGTAYAQRMAELNLQVYNEMFELSRGISDRYLKLLGTSTTSAKKAAQPHAASAATASVGTAARRKSSKKK